MTAECTLIFTSMLITFFTIILMLKQKVGAKYYSSVGAWLFAV